MTDEICDDGGEFVGDACSSLADAASGEDIPVDLLAALTCGIAAGLGCKEVVDKEFPGVCQYMFSNGCCGSFNPNT